MQRDRAIHNHWGEMQRKSLPNNLSAAEQQLFRAIHFWAQDTKIINAILRSGSATAMIISPTNAG